MIKELAQPHVKAFIRAYENYPDLEKLILQRNQFPHIPVKEAVEQIKARRKAKEKLPEWYGHPDIIYPPLVSMEQCSSALLAKFKSSIISGKRLVDLTGGAGIDTYYLSKTFNEVDYVEPEKYILEVTQHNLSVLGAKNIRFHHSPAEGFLKKMSGKADYIYLDPDRRNVYGKKFMKIGDYQPNIIEISDLLFKKGGKIFVKASPMLDITQALRQFRYVRKIYIIAVYNECKEVLYLLDPLASDLSISTINFLKDGGLQELAFCKEDESSIQIDYSLPSRYIYDPNVAILKAGAFKMLASRFHLKKLHKNSHLFTSDKPVYDFPGRIFDCKAVCTLKKKEMAQYLPDNKAHIAVKNFPLTVKEIRKTTRIKEGGNLYLFATTDLMNRKIILITEKINL